MSLLHRKAAAFSTCAPFHGGGSSVYKKSINTSGLHHVPSTRNHVNSRRAQVRMMSGVNGGIDYDIDLSSLPDELRYHAESIQRGPDSPTALIESTRILASSYEQNPDILYVLVDVLGYNNPVAAQQSVSALTEAGTKAIPLLLRGVAAFNYAVNAYALRALGAIGDASVASVCAACAQRGPIPGVRRAAVRALARLRFEDVEEVEKYFGVLLDIARIERDWGVRYAAVVAIEQFECKRLVSSALWEEALKVLQDAARGNSIAVGEEEEAVETDHAVRARATVALEVLAGMGVHVGVK